MPLIFGLLVILNAVFLAWQFFQHQNSSDSLPQQPALGKPLQLLSQSGVASEGNAASSNSADEAAPKPAQVGAGSSCFRVGPVTNPDLLPQLEAAFSNAGLTVKVEDLTQENTRFWVYIPPLVSLSKANDMEADLRAKGYRAEVVADGQFANAVSLGEFQDQDKADQLRDRLLAGGFQAETHKSPIVKRQQWLKISSTAAVSKGQIDKVIAGSGMRRESAPCEF